MLVDADFDSRRVHGLGFAERAAFADQHTTALAQGAIQGFNDGDLAFALGAGPVRTGGKGLGVSRKQVCEVPAVAAVAVGQGLPEAAGRGRIAPAQDPSHDAPTGLFHGQPKPKLAPFTAHKCPHLIEFKRFPPPALRFFGRSRDNGGRACCAFSCQFGRLHARHAGYAHDAALRIALGQELFSLRVAGRPFGGDRRKQGLVAAGFTLVTGVPAAMPVAPNLFAAAASAKTLSLHHKRDTKFILP